MHMMIYMCVCVYVVLYMQTNDGEDMEDEIGVGV